MKKLLICFLFSSMSFAMTDESKLKDVAFSKQWLRLLHYEKNGSDYLSQLDGKDFFFAKDGKTNPLTELKASIEGLNGDKKIGRLKLLPLCAFPERSRFISEKFDIEFKQYECPKLKHYYSLFQEITGVSIVFSSAYPNNPASMFGHTFLKFHSKRKSDLLDRSVSYAAWTPPDVNMLAFMYKGVAGGYPGLWSIEPYYKKVNEYINSESRDLWEYELNVTPEEAKRIADHLWEVEVSSYFEYYFFDENCAYQILKAVEAVKIDWDITEYKLYVIPAETIKNVAWQKNKIKKVDFRPSLYHQVKIKLDRLDEAKQEEVLAILDHKEVKDPSPEVLSAALTGLLYDKAKKKKKWNDNDQKWEEKILALAAQKSISKDVTDIPEIYLKSKPDTGHDPMSFYFSTVNLENSHDKSIQAAQFKFRTAYHDLMANDTGLANFSEIEFPWIDFQVQSNGEIKLNELGGFQTTSLFPLSRLENRKSWRVKLLMQRETIDPCYNCNRAVLEAGIGATLGGLNSRLYGLALLLADFHPELENGYRSQPTIELGYLFRTKDYMKTRLLYRHLFNFRDKYETDEYHFSNAFHLNTNTELRLEGSARRSTYYVDNFEHTGTLRYIKYFR